MRTTLHDLAANVGQALAFWPPNYPRSVLGDPSSWQAGQRPPSEVDVLRGGLFGVLDSAANILLPSWPGRPDWLPDWVPAPPSPLAPYRASSVDMHPRALLPDTRYRDESWLLLNGICTDERVLRINADGIHRLFGRPLTLLHNQTNGALIDLAECALGKGRMAATEAVRALFPALLGELKNQEKNRVVLIAHSQGTIIGAIFVALLRELLETSASATDDAATQSIEAVKGKRLLSRKLPAKRCRHARVLVIKPSPEGSRILPLAEAPEAASRVSHWLNWGRHAALGLPAITEAELRKLEIYNFATCASELRAVIPGKQPVPYIENFGNGRDLVARLGVLAPATGCGSTRIEGLKFVRHGQWGHLLNAHYLVPLVRQWNGDDRSAFVAIEAAADRQSKLLAAYRQEHPVPA